MDLRGEQVSQYTHMRIILWSYQCYSLRIGGKYYHWREVTDSSYQDPITNELVNGNPDVVPSTVDNIDLRAEWFFANGNNVTISLFNKEIADPIEYFESPASDTNTAREIINAAETTITGIEVDGVLAHPST